jgi:hypothetical protein
MTVLRRQRTLALTVASAALAAGVACRLARPRLSGGQAPVGPSKQAAVRTAAAYAVGRCVPVLRTPLLIGAVAGAATRSRRPSETPTALAAGVGVGVGVAMALTRGAERLEQARPAPRGARRRVAIVVNVDAGSARLARRGAQALRRHPVTVVCDERVAANDLPAAVRRAVAAAGPGGVVAVAGGDGTIGTAAEILAGSDRRLASLRRAPATTSPAR